ncbi:hypothetical protein BJY04DRAFT_217383 [Aspergillus karnatakaensis]|uniref:uncharacterized protein n=1 Tax=Aspergillus karnatakaensis TaxID=1810916 RepID=UPI003CCD6B21
MDSTKCVPIVGRFGRLPTEVLRQIFLFLAEERDEELRTNLRPCEPSQAVNALHSLAATCQLFHAIAQPLLYGSITVKSIPQLRQLLMTVSRNPRIGARVKKLSFYEHPDVSAWDDRPNGFCLGPGHEDRSALWRCVKLATSLPGFDDEIPKGWERRGERRNARDAVLDLFELFLNLPNMSAFHYNGFTCRDLTWPWNTAFITLHSTDFQFLFTRVMHGFFTPGGSLLRPRYFPSMVEFGVSGVGTRVAFGFHRECLNIPSIQTLSISYTNCFDRYTSWVPFTKSYTLRELRLKVPGISVSMLTKLLVAIKRLEIFYCEYQPPKNKLVRLGPILATLYLHQLSLKELNVSLSRAVTSRDLASKSEQTFQSWSRYTELSILAIPDVALYDKMSYTKSRRHRLPPNVVSLSISQWLDASLILPTLDKLSLHKESFTKLSEITIVGKTQPDRDFQKKLAELRSAFVKQGVTLRYKVH